MRLLSNAPHQNRRNMHRAVQRPSDIITGCLPRGRRAPRGGVQMNAYGGFGVARFVVRYCARAAYSAQEHREFRCAIECRNRKEHHPATAWCLFFKAWVFVIVVHGNRNLAVGDARNAYCRGGCVGGGHTGGSRRGSEGMDVGACLLTTRRCSMVGT